MRANRTSGGVGGMAGNSRHLDPIPEVAKDWGADGRFLFVLEILSPLQQVEIVS